MIRLPRLAALVFLASLLSGLLAAQARVIKWSPWRPIDDRYLTVRIRTSYDDNEGRGWTDGRHHWRFEVKNTSAKSAVKVGLAFQQWNYRTRVWDSPAEGLPPGFELDPGETHEGITSSPDKAGFEYRYAIGTLGEDAKAKRIVSGLTHSRIVTAPIKESSLVTNAAFTKALAPEMEINAMPAPADTPAVASPTAPSKPAKVAAAAEAKPAPAPADLPMHAAALPPASTDGLNPAAKFALWTQRAQQGDAESMFELGRACRFGDGTARDNVAATEWYRQAALRGHAAAMTKLGFAYDSGLGVERSEANAIEWWRKAAALGETEAAKRLARLGVTP